MANERKAFSAPGLNIYSVYILNGGEYAYAAKKAFEPYDPDNWALYASAMTEQSPGVYFSDGPYGGGHVMFYIMAGATPAITDQRIGIQTADGYSFFLPETITLRPTQPAITWGQQKIVADVPFEGALDISNTNAAGTGLHNYGGTYGEFNNGLYSGQYNFGSGEYGVGQNNHGIVYDVTGHDPDILTGSELNDIKGAGWTDENLTTIDANIDSILADTGTDGVLISAGTGAKQIDVSGGVVKANLAQILGSALTETSGLIAAAFKKFFNIATPTGTVNSLPDAVPGASGGLPTTNGTKVNQTVDLTAGQSIAANGGTVATVTNLTNLPAVTNDWLTAAGIKADAVTKIQTGLATPTNITAGTITNATNVTNGVTLADDAITSAKFDESSAFPVKSADTGATAIARVGADSDTLETLSDEIAAVKAETALIVADTGTDGVIVASLANDSITAAALKTDAVTEIQTGLATPTNITAGTITTVTNLTNAPTNGDLTATMKSSVTTAASSATPALSAAGVDAILDEVVIGTYTMRQLLRVISAKMVGKATGGGTTAITYRGLDDSSNIIVETVDASGNRSAVTLTV